MANGRFVGWHRCQCNAGGKQCPKMVCPARQYFHGHKPVSAYTRFDLARRGPTQKATLEGAFAGMPLGVGNYREVLTMLRHELVRLDRQRAILILAIGACEKLVGHRPITAEDLPAPETQSA